MRVLAAIGTYTDDDGWCFPHQATIARDLDLTRQTVSQAVSNLAEFGYLQTECRVASGNGKRGLLYRVILDPPSIGENVEPQDVVPDVGKRRHRQTREQKRKPDPVSEFADIGADVGTQLGPMSANSDIGYIEGTTQRNDTPFKSPKGDKKKSQKREQGRTPKEFAEAWAMWPRPGASKAKSLRFWRAHRATGAAKLAAVRAFLATHQAKQDGGRFVPSFQNWLRDSLDSFVERSAKRPPRSAQIEGPPEWRAAAAKLRKHDPAVFASYWSGCEVVEVDPLTVVPSSSVAFDVIRQRGLADAAQRDLGLTIVVLDPRGRAKARG